MTENYMHSVEWKRRVWAWMQLSAVFEDAAGWGSPLMDRDTWFGLGYI